MANRAYKTLPTAFRKDDPAKHTNVPSTKRFGGSPRSSSSSSGSSEGKIFGLNLHLGLSHLLSGGINLLGQLRRRTPSTTTVSSPSSPVSESIFTEISSSSASSSTRASYFDAQCHSASAAAATDATEMIELTSFASVPLAEGDSHEQQGLGHDFKPVNTFNPTWCDLCRELIWGLYDTGGTRCCLCDLTCHEKCKSKIRLNCAIFESGIIRRESTSSSDSSSSPSHSDAEEESTLANISTLRDEVNAAHAEEEDEDEDQRTLKNPLLVELSPDAEPETDELADLSTGSPEHESYDSVDKKVFFSLDSLSRWKRLTDEKLQHVLKSHNAAFPPGQETVCDVSAGWCKGFIRVQLNLRRPINVLPGTKPPLVYHITSSTRSLGSEDERATLTSFYLPSDTVKVLHVEAETTTHDVIRNLLKKFRIADNPYKFALYEKKKSPEGAAADLTASLRSAEGSSRSLQHFSSTLGRVRMRRMNDAECPLWVALSWHLDEHYEGNMLVLQENDPGEILWESFTLPELKNFLRILDREEAWYKKKIHEKYDFLNEYMQHLAMQKKQEQLLLGS